MKPTTLLTAAILFAMTTIASAQVVEIFNESFDDGMAADRWSDLIVSQENTGIAPDSTVDYAFDYSAITPFNTGVTIPSAPNSTGGSTIGIYLTSNNTNQCPDAANPGCAAGGGIDDEGEGSGVYHETFDLPASGNYTVQFDVFSYWNGGGGSTEYSTVGINDQRSQNAPVRFNINNGDGLAYQADTDGDSATDLIRYEGPAGPQTGLGGFEDIPDGTIPGVPTGDAVTIGIFNQWVVMELEFSDTHDNVAWKINGALIDLFDNSAGTFNAGTILLGHSDPFNSVNGAIDGFTNGSIIDNVIVNTIPEPSAAALALLASLACAAVARRKD